MNKKVAELRAVKIEKAFKNFLIRTFGRTISQSAVVSLRDAFEAGAKWERQRSKDDHN